jgi:hypothetical protein
MAKKRTKKRTKLRAKARPQARAKGRTKMSKPAGGDAIDRFIEAAAQVLALPVEPAWHGAIRFNLEVTLKAAGLFADFPLPDDAEPAPVFIS